MVVVSLYLNFLLVIICCYFNLKIIIHIIKAIRIVIKGIIAIIIDFINFISINDSGFT